MNEKELFSKILEENLISKEELYEEIIKANCEENTDLSENK